MKLTAEQIEEGTRVLKDDWTQFEGWLKGALPGIERDGLPVLMNNLKKFILSDNMMHAEKFWRSVAEELVIVTDEEHLAAIQALKEDVVGQEISASAKEISKMIFANLAADMLKKKHTEVADIQKLAEGVLLFSLQCGTAYEKAWKTFELRDEEGS